MHQTRSIKAVRFCALFFSGLALVPTGAHLAELPHKIGMSAAEYLTVQQIYRGWALFGIVIFAAILSTLLLAIAVRGAGRTFKLTVIALLCIVGTQGVFWIFTFPVNQATVNWSTLPPNWTELRAQWEYSHAVSGGLNLIAFAALILSMVHSSARDLS
jgi:hypothetical protein